MKYLPLLTEEDIHYICSVIPVQDSVDYFEKYPKEFAKIMPGFRAKSMKNKEQTSRTLYRSRNQPFIFTFLEKHINKWLIEIQEHLEKLINEGEFKDIAYIHTLSKSFFAGNIALYFKLIEDKRSEEYVAMLSVVIAVIKENERKYDDLQKNITLKEADINCLKEQLDTTNLDLRNAQTKIDYCTLEIETLKKDITNVEKLYGYLEDVDDGIVSLKSKITGHENIIRQIKIDVQKNKKLHEENEFLNLSLNGKYQLIEKPQEHTVRKRKCPSDIEEFKDFLGYNLENIGVPETADFFYLLKDHLGNILFKGLPIVVNRSVGMLLIKCVSNALVGQKKFHTLSFRNGLNMDDVDRFLTNSGRVICLDNFIGNCNETELLRYFDSHRNKVFFLTVAYDGTLRYVSKELLSYVYYLNLNRIKAFSSATELTEDPSTIEEVECVEQKASESKQFSNFLRAILCEFSFPQSFIEQRCASVSLEQDLCRILAFEVLPYCKDVLQIPPYNNSERFQKYAGSQGRCLFKRLFMEWFEH